MADTTSPPATAQLNGNNSLSDIFSSAWNSVTNTFSNVLHTGEAYWQALATANINAATATADATRQAQLAGTAAATPGQPATGIPSQTLLLLGVGAVALYLIARK